MQESVKEQKKYLEIVDFIKKQRQENVSLSFLQLNFDLDYDKAVVIAEKLESEGIVTISRKDDAIELYRVNFVKNLLASKNNISEQLRLLRRYRDRDDVQEYIKSLEENEYVTEYVRYMIDRYYYGNVDAKKAKKNCLEKCLK